MKHLFTQLFRRHYRIPYLEAVERIHRSFSPAERFLYGIFVVCFAVGAFGLLHEVNALFLTEVPARGGELKEGIIGNPRFINPLLALSDSDRDLTALVYSGLLKPTSEGTLVPDLAERYEIAEDGLSYTFYLRPDAVFHDGTPVTADDVIFTIQKTQDPILKSPKRANWEGIEVEKVSDRILTLKLKQPYAPFLENATLGILPKHLWKDTDAEQFPFASYNLRAIGSGPYEIKRIKQTNDGIPKQIELSAFEDYALGEPFISSVSMRFYSSEKDLHAGFSRGEIESINTITPDTGNALGVAGYRVERTSLLRIFAVFFNQNQAPIFAEKTVREALELATDKEKIVATVLHGYGVPIDSPVPPLLFSEKEKEATTTEARIEEAKALLDRAKWIVNPDTGIRERTKSGATETLSFSLATSNVPELRDSAEMLKAMWERVGVEVKVQIFESGDLNQNIIRPRRFDALLFGEIIGRDLDLFAFWHSSQRNDPGLNVAMYTNAHVDKLLEEARRTIDTPKRLLHYAEAATLIKEDVPAVFVYSPEFIYVLPWRVKGVVLGHATVPSERFLDIHTWHINTEKVWDIFAD